MALSPKQLAFGWINSKLEPATINPEEDELQILNGGKPLKPELFEKTVAVINEELAKVKIRYDTYWKKYGNGDVVAPVEEESSLPETE